MPVPQVYKPNIYNALLTPSPPYITYNSLFTVPPYPRTPNPLILTIIILTTPFHAPAGGQTSPPSIAESITFRISPKTLPERCRNIVCMISTTNKKTLQTSDFDKP